MLTKPYQFILKKNERHKHIGKKMDIDIVNINTLEKRNRVNKTQWKKIQEVIEENYFKEYNIFPDDFIEKM